MAAAPDGPGVETALDWAETAAMLGDFDEAASWLDYVELHGGALTAELIERRRAWRERVDLSGDPAEA